MRPHHDVGSVAGGGGLLELGGQVGIDLGDDDGDAEIGLEAVGDLPEGGVVAVGAGPDGDGAVLEGGGGGGGGREGEDGEEGGAWGHGVLPGARRSAAPSRRLSGARGVLASAAQLSVERGRRRGHHPAAGGPP